ncbi:MAG: sugar phosphate isomerase/epimerase [Rhodothermales bacterium]
MNTPYTSRRHFLKQAAGLGGAMLASGASLAALNPFAAPRIGVQLYTLRDLMKDDFEGTIEKVAAIGYKEVEFAGYYDRSPDQVRALLDRLGLTSPSVHAGLEGLREDLEGNLDTYARIGHTYVTIPALPGAFGGQIAADAWPKFASEFNTIGKACKARGLKLAYHNHNFEFAPVGNQTALDVLLSQTDPDLVSFELDLAWAYIGGQDPLAWFDRYPGRFAMWHVKDVKGPDVVAKAFKETPREAFRVFGERVSAVGDGDIDFKKIFAAAKKSGMEHYFVENDFPKDALANITASYKSLSTWVPG